MCTCLWCVIVVCMLVICYRDILCGHHKHKMYVLYVWIAFIFQSKHAVPYYEFLFLWIPFFPAASCSSGSRTAGLCSSNTTVRIKFFYAWSQATERETFPSICAVVVTVLLSLCISWIFGIKATSRYLWSLCSRWYCSSLALVWVNTLFACTMQPSEVYFYLIKAV